MKSFRLALSFFSRLPVGDPGQVEEKIFFNSLRLVPLVGLVLGICWAVFAILINWLIPPILSGMILLAAIVYSTGGIHLDGFMDTMDGLFSARNPQRVLEIMKDSRVGGHAVVAVILLLMIKAAALYSMLYPSSHALWLLASEMIHSLENPLIYWPEILTWGIGPLLFTILSEDVGVGLLAGTLFWVPLISRWGLVEIGFCFPPAKGEGLGKSFHEVIDKNIFIKSTVGVLAVSGIFGGLAGWIAMGLSAFFTLQWGKYLTGLLGGVTGDIHGANTEISEVISLVTAAVVFNFIG